MKSIINSISGMLQSGFKGLQNFVKGIGTSNIVKSIKETKVVNAISSGINKVADTKVIKTITNGINTSTKFCKEKVTSAISWLKSKFVKNETAETVVNA